MVLAVEGKTAWRAKLDSHSSTIAISITDRKCDLALRTFLTGPRALVTINCAASTPPHIRPRRLAWPRTSPFHGGNTGSNPVGDANKIKYLQEPQFPTRYALRYGLVCE